jgi:hypothetical protein
MLVQKNKYSHFLKMAFIAMLFIGIFLRFDSLGNQSYWMDESYTVLGIIELSEHAAVTTTHYSCFMYCGPTAVLVHFWGESATVFRTLAAISGALLIGAVYISAKILFNRTIASYAGFVTAFSYIEIAWSRQVRWYTLFSFFVWVAIFLFYKTYKDSGGKRLYLYASITMALAAGLTHALGFLLPVLLVTWIALATFIKKSKNFYSSSYASLLTGLVGALVILQWLNPLFSLGLEGLSVHNLLPYYAHFYFWEYWPFFPFIFYALANYRSHPEEKLFLVYIALGYLIPLSFFTNILHYRYLFHLVPIIFILTSCGIFEVTQKIPSVLVKWLFLLCLIIIFFSSGKGVLLPKENYFLESDDESISNVRDYYAYTPQPDWTAAYGYIKDNMTSEDIIISTQPQFTEIFLGIEGYWLANNQLGGTAMPDHAKESYVGAKSISNPSELEELKRTRHGYVVYDFMATDGRLPDALFISVVTNTHLVFYNHLNHYSQIWVYRF